MTIKSFETFHFLLGLLLKRNQLYEFEHQFLEDFLLLLSVFFKRSQLYRFQYKIFETLFMSSEPIVKREINFIGFSFKFLRTFYFSWVNCCYGAAVGTGCYGFALVNN